MWPANLKSLSFLYRFNLGLSNRWSWRSRLFFNRQIGKWYAEHGDIFWFRKIVIGNSAKSTADNLFTQELTGECTYAENMRNGLRVPTFGKHVYTDNALHLFSGFSFFANSVHFWQRRKARRKGAVRYRCKHAFRRLGRADRYAYSRHTCIHQSALV